MYTVLSAITVTVHIIGTFVTGRTVTIKGGLVHNNHTTIDEREREKGSKVNSNMACITGKQLQYPHRQKYYSEVIDN